MNLFTNTISLLEAVIPKQKYKYLKERRDNNIDMLTDELKEAHINLVGKHTDARIIIPLEISDEFILTKSQFG